MQIRRKCAFLKEIFLLRNTFLLNILLELIMFFKVCIEVLEVNLGNCMLTLIQVHFYKKLLYMRYQINILFCTQQQCDLESLLTLLVLTSCQSEHPEPPGRSCPVMVSGHADIPSSMGTAPSLSTLCPYQLLPPASSVDHNSGGGRGVWDGGAGAAL